MGFFDDLGKKMTNAGQRAVQKTQEMSEVARINSLISQNENTINGIYYQIGKMYVNLHPNDAEGEFAEMVKHAIALAQQNEEYRNRIQDLRGMQRCPRCGAEVSKEFAFCNFCGAPMPVNEVHEAPSDAVQCPKCGTMVEKGMRFCTSCGQEMPLSYAEAPSGNTDAVEEEKRCPQCGAVIRNNSSFCAQCGSKLL